MRSPRDSTDVIFSDQLPGGLPDGQVELDIFNFDWDLPNAGAQLATLASVDPADILTNQLPDTLQDPMEWPELDPFLQTLFVVVAFMSDKAYCSTSLHWNAQSGNL